VGFETGFAVNPVLARDAMKPLALRTDVAAPPRLGWNTWIPGPVPRRGSDAADAIFEAELVEETAA
jgi:type VI secretion system protein ImpH